MDTIHIKSIDDFVKYFLDLKLLRTMLYDKVNSDEVMVCKYIIEEHSDTLIKLLTTLSNTHSKYDLFIISEAIKHDTDDEDVQEIIKFYKDRENQNE